MKPLNWKQEWPFIILAFLLPLIFFYNVFTSHSFGMDCAPSVMGNHEPYGQVWVGGNPFCSTSPDPGAYVWQHPAHWLEGMRDYTEGKFPLWTQNIGGGIPLAANFISTIYFIPMLPFILLFKLSGNDLLYLDLFFLFRYMLLASGMYLFLRSLGVSRIVGLIGGLALFSTGYYILMPNIGHHNVDALMPFYLFCINMIFVTRRKHWVGLAAICMGISFLGGMPEISAFILFFSGLYILFLTFVISKKPDYAFLTWSSLATIVGIFIGSILIIPGLEYIIHGGSTHHDGAVIPKSIPFLNILTFIFPEIYVNPDVKQQLLDAGHIKFHLESWNYIGTIITFLFFSSIVYVLSKFKHIGKSGTLQLILFFCIFALVMIVQEYSILHTFIFEHLPVFKETYYPKYSSVLINFTVITSSTLALHEMLKKRSYSIILSWIVMMIICLLASLYAREVYEGYFQYIKYNLTNRNIAHGLFYASVVTFFLIMPRWRLLIPYGIFILLIFEFLNYMPKGGYQGRYDTLRKPPAVAYLQERNDRAYRMFGVENILYPNLATVYDLQDMRMLDALWIKRYFTYIEHFFAEPYVQRITSLKEVGAKEPANIITNPFFDLLSVKYLLSYSPLESVLFDKTSFINEIIKNNPQKQIKNDNVTVNKDTKSSLVFTDSESVSFPIEKDNESSNLIFQIASVPANPPVVATESAQVSVQVIKDTSVIAQQVQTVSKEWTSLTIGPISPDVQGKLEVQITTTVPEDIPVAVSGFYWNNNLDLFNQKYRQVYNKEMRIYENTTAVPRVHFVSSTICTNPVEKDDYEPIVEILKKNSSTIKNLAVVETKNCPPARLDTSRAQLKNTDYQDMQISFMYSSPSPQYAVVQDAYYPGWNVYINGKKSEVEPVNIAFRGIRLPAGENVKVELRYEPKSFYAGLILTLLATALALIYLWHKESIDESSLSLTLHKRLGKIKLK